ncbi:MAG: hypothetical protein K0R48_1430 [Gammaproteobacteria bacterium]|nr:hypothetical protein [Gammaproteobacteria bacterium]
MAIGVWVSVGGGFITMLGLLTTWCMAYFDKRYRKSLFYLEKTTNYFSKAIAILSECKNNNVKWHQAINALREADKLKSSLTDNAHQSIYVADYIDRAYQIVDIIKKIDDFRFFYGVTDYRDKSALTLYQESKSPTLSLDWPNYKVSPEELLCLCKFVDKANGAHNMKSRGVASENVFKSDYFREPLSDWDISEFTKISLKVVFSYIKNVEENNEVAEREWMRQAEILEREN